MSVPLSAQTKSSDTGSGDTPPVWAVAPVSPPHVSLAPPWLEMQTLTLAMRYRYVDTSAGVVTANQAQHAEQVKFRVKFDTAGKLGVVAGLATGNSFTSGWENAGIGIPSDFFWQFYLKHLYVNVMPTTGVEFQMGSLAVLRGEATEITTYDNDGYVIGERLSVKRPKDLFFDEVSVTRGYLGETTVPNFLKRTSRLAEWNFYQVLVDKKVTPALGVSAELTGVAGVRTGRAAFYAKIKDGVVVDGVRLETYRRFDNPAGGYALSIERAPRSWMTLGGGVANIDRNYGGLNADRFSKGQRWFVNSAVTFLKDVSVLAFYQHAFGNDYTLTNRSRLDVVLQLNALKALQRHGIF